MAKKNNNNNNFFSNMIREKGEDFISCMPVRDIMWNAKKIFKELSRCNIDVSKYGVYFLNQQFNRGLYAAAQQQYTESSISFAGVNMLLQQTMQQYGQVNPEIQIVCESHRRTMEVYSIIMDTLDKVLYYQNYELLFPLINVLSNYRNNI